jgi:hypothetical protein
MLHNQSSSSRARTAWKYVANEYSFRGGDGQLLANGDLGADFNAGAAGFFSDIFEVAPGNVARGFGICRRRLRMRTGASGYRVFIPVSNGDKLACRLSKGLSREDVFPLASLN